VRQPLRGARLRLIGAAILAVVAFAGVNSPAAPAAPGPIPVYAYYYIWFNTSSWNRAKTDFPLLGRYSSDERLVMRRHVEWAKTAGVRGFVVSWKSTPVLDRRLALLRDVAEVNNFRLALIYQGLDFERRPLPVPRIAKDLEAFLARYGKDPVFRGPDGKPLVVWSGTWKFSRAEVAGVSELLRGRALLLASERNVKGYERLADLVDGNAYYWSSVNPNTYPDYAGKLAGMAAAVHERGGLWVAPAAPGFDARLIGGKTVVPRKDGGTLRRQLDVALQSQADLVGLISWNEFSENTHVEPSLAYRGRYLEVVADVLGASAPRLSEFDSSEPAATGTGYGIPLAAGFVALLIGGVLVVAARGTRRGPPPDPTREAGQTTD